MTKLDWNKANRAEMPKLARKKTETQKRQEAVAKAYANGTSRERERIIKLLEPLGCEANGVEHDCQNGLGYTTAADLIALIKGEQK